MKLPHKHDHHQRPRWWPEGEPWPPERPMPHFRPSRFVRRLGCLFLLFNLGLVTFLALAAGFAAHLLGLLEIPGSFAWVIPLGILILVLMLTSLAWGGRRLRRMAAPLGDLMDAAGRVAEGDYAAQVQEQGPREVRSLVRAFNAMTARLQSAAEQRRGLLADISHELRTPLTVIQGGIEGMLDGVYAPDEAHLKSLLEETRVLGRLVDDLRTLALAESGALQLRRQPTDLAQLIDETVAVFRPQADAAGVQLEAQARGSLPLLDLDPQRLHEVLSNLVANALRYTPPGGSIRVTLDRDDAPGAPRAVVSVADSGAGIAAADLPHVFDRFYRARDSSGAGLGLAIARNLVEAHGGTIQAESQPGQGTVMRFFLPVE